MQAILEISALHCDYDKTHGTFLPSNSSTHESQWHRLYT